MSSMVFDLARALRWASGAAAAALVLVGCGGGGGGADLSPVPTASAAADPLTAFALAQQSVVAPAALAATPPASGNLVSNAGFEGGLGDWLGWGNTRIASGEASSGTSALAVGVGAGGAGQEVAGIVPGRTYRLTAQARVSDASEIVYVGVNFIDASGAPFTQNSVLVASTSYTTASLEVVAPPNAARALVYVWKNAGPGLAFVDDFGLEATPAAGLPLVSSGNLLSNGGFDIPGFVGWQSFTNLKAPSTDAASGPFAAQVGTGAGGLGQHVSGIVAGNTYRLGAQAKVSAPGETGYLGVMFEDDAGAGLLAQNVVFRSTSYSALQADFTAPPHATRALVFAWKNAGAGFIFVDEVSLVQVDRVTPQPDPAAPPTVQLSGSLQRTLGDRQAGSHASLSMARLGNGLDDALAWLAFDPSTGGSQLCYSFDRMDADSAIFGPSFCLEGAQPKADRPTHVLPRPGGGFVAVWTDASDLGVRSQAIDVFGRPVGGIQAGPQQPVAAEAAALAGGGYVLLTMQPGGQNTTASTITFQRHASDGTPIGAPTSVGDSGGFDTAQVVPLAGGGFAVAWLQGGVTGTVMTRMFTADGTPVGAPMVASGAAPVCFESTNPRIVRSCQFQILRAFAPMDDGGYAVVWMDGFGRGSIQGTFARRFRPDGTPGSAVGQLSNGDLHDLVMAPAGPDSFVLAWLEATSSGSIIAGRAIDATPLR